MAKKTYTLKYSGSVKPQKTKFLTSPAIPMDFQGDVDLDEVDASKIKAIRKTFQSEMKSRLKKQLSFLDMWLKEKDQLIAKMMKQHEDLKKFGFPSTASAAKALAAKNKALEALAKETQGLKVDYVKIVNNWAKNAREQQGVICLMTALKKARAKTISNKSWRIGTGIAIKATLVVAAIVMTVAAIILTAGTTAPIFIALAAAGVLLSGGSAIAGVGVTIVNNASTEKKILKNVQKDVKTVKDALKPIKGAKSSLAKHVTELRNVMKVRIDSTNGLKMDIKRKKAEIGGYDSHLVRLRSELAKQAPPDKKMLAKIASREKKVTVLKAQIKSIEKKMTKMDADNQAAQALLDELQAMNINLEKVSATTGSSVLGNLKARYTSTKGWIELGNDVGGLVSGLSGVHT